MSVLVRCERKGQLVTGQATGVANNAPVPSTILTVNVIGIAPMILYGHRMTTALLIVLLAGIVVVMSIVVVIQ